MLVRSCAGGWRIPIVVGVAAVMAGAAHSGQAGADADAAREAFDRGIELFDAGDPAAALAEFERSYALRDLPVVLLNMGVCHEQLGRTADALQVFRRFLAVHGMEAMDEDVEYVRARIRVLAASEAGAPSGLQGSPGGEGVASGGAGASPVVPPPVLDPPERGSSTPTAGDADSDNGGNRGAPPPPPGEDRVRVEISTNVPGAEIRVGRELVGRGGVAGFVLPGPYEVVVTAPGYGTRREQIVVELGRPLLLPVMLRPSGTGRMTAINFDDSAGWVGLRVAGGSNDIVTSCSSPCTMMITDDGEYDLVSREGEVLGRVDAQGGTQVWRLDSDSTGQLVGGLVLFAAGVALLSGGGYLALEGDERVETGTGVGLLVLGACLVVVGIPVAKSWRASDGAKLQYTMHDDSPTAVLFPQVFPAAASGGGTAYGLGLRVLF